MLLEAPFQLKMSFLSPNIAVISQPYPHAQTAHQITDNPTTRLGRVSLHDATNHGNK